VSVYAKVCWQIFGGCSNISQYTFACKLSLFSCRC